MSDTKTYCQIDRARNRAGLTLLELLLVLSLLVAIAAVAMPAVSVTLDKHELRNAGELVRTRWAKARVQAMQNGRTYVFRYELDGPMFSVEPWISADDYLESSELGTLSGSPMTSSMNSSSGSSQLSQDVAPVLETLADGIRFLGSEIAEDTRALLNNELSGDMDETSLSPPIYFYPDGTTSSARVVLVNRRDRYITVSVRGLTGMVKVSDIQSAMEVQ